MAGKFSIYVKDDELKRNIELLAWVDNTSITQLIGGVLQAYVDGRADDVAFARETEEKRQSRQPQAQAPAQEDTDQQQRTGNPNLLY